VALKQILICGMTALLLGVNSPLALGQSFHQHPSEKPLIGRPWTEWEQGPRFADPRPPAPSRLSEDLLWIPRGLLFPLYVTTEYLLRRPLGWLLTTAEKNDWARFFLDLFTFGTDRKIGFFPTAFFHFNFRPSVGLYFFANDVGIEGHQLRASAMFGGERWWQASFTDRWRLWQRDTIDLQLSFLQRPDFIFHGLGPESLHEVRTRFLKETSRVQLQYVLNYFRSSHADFRMAFEHHSVDTAQTTGHDPSLNEGVERGFFPRPNNPPVYNLLRLGTYAFFDNRANHREEGTGISARLNMEYAHLLTQPARWLTLAPRIAGHLDLGHNRILSLNLFAEHQFRLNSEPIPFSELLTPGMEPHILGGFWPGRLLGASMLGGTLEYRYEVWALLDGTVFFTLGNVYGENFEGLSLASLRPSYGIGICSIGRPDAKFHFLFAFGHKPFSQGAGFDGAQLMFGYRPNL
jgi:hypothetical protein